MCVRVVGVCVRVVGVVCPSGRGVCPVSRVLLEAVYTRQLGNQFNRQKFNVTKNQILIIMGNQRKARKHVAFD